MAKPLGACSQGSESPVETPEPFGPGLICDASHGLHYKCADAQTVRDGSRRLTSRPWRQR